MGSSTTSTPKSPNFSHLVSPSIRPVRSDPDLIAEIEEEDHSTNSNGIVHLIYSCISQKFREISRDFCEITVGQNI